MNKTLLRFATATFAVVLIASHQPSAYTLKTAKWNSTPVAFYVNTENLDAPPSAVLSAVQFGAYAWTNQSSAAFSFYYAGSTSASTVTSNGKNEVFFRNASNGGAIATTYTYSSGGRILDTDIVFWDGGFQFFTGDSGCSGGFYIEDVATHEFGHALGLGHSAVSGATMYPSLGYCSVHARWLTDDDRQGVEALYPSGSSNRAPAVSISSPAAGATVTDGTALTFSGSASDTEDGDLGTAIAWVSSRDGAIGTGQTFQGLLSVGTHTVTARVTDSGGATAEAQVSVSVEAPAVPSGFVVTASAYKVRGWQNVDLKWSGATSASVDIYRDGARIATAANTGQYTDAISRKGPGAYTYVLCEAGTATCSTPKAVTF
jgi:Matrixin